MQTRYQVAANAQTKRPACALSPPIYAAAILIHHRLLLLLLSLRADTHLTVPREVEG